MDSASSENKSKERMEVKKRNAVALWTLNVETENCAICRNHIKDMCIECQAKQDPAADCAVAWGVCDHAYHFHCITRWLTTREVCPLDNTQWEFKKYGN